MIITVNGKRRDMSNSLMTKELVDYIIECDHVLNVLTNGCGSGWISKTLSSIVTYITNVNIDKLCDIHDLEYGLPDKYKSITHRKQADSNLDIGITNYLLGETDTSYFVTRRITNMYHIVLILYGRFAYGK